MRKEEEELLLFFVSVLSDSIPSQVGNLRTREMGGAGEGYRDQQSLRVRRLSYTRPSSLGVSGNTETGEEARIRGQETSLAEV